MTEQRKPKCVLCKSTKNVGVLINDTKSIKICKYCNEMPTFEGLFDFQKIDAITAGYDLAKTNRLHMPFALNVALGRYSLAEAQRRTKLREMELSGKSVDAYAIAKRTPGSFRSVK